MELGDADFEVCARPETHSRRSAARRVDGRAMPNGSTPEEFSTERIEH
jgi:hypothetical protein